jgi:tartrate dehydratase alpha subunit/fumarate hydratase class I-like protein
MLFRTRGRKKRSKRSKRKEKEKIIIRKIKRKENEEAEEDRIVCHIDTGIKIIFVFTGFVFVL